MMPLYDPEHVQTAVYVLSALGLAGVAFLCWMDREP